MDGGPRQEMMHARIKREVKEFPLRRGAKAVHSSDSINVALGPPSSEIQNPATPARALFGATPGSHIHREEPNSSAEPFRASLQRQANYTLTCKDLREDMGLGDSDTFLFMFYLEHLFPFLFPFYNPSLLKGGRAWILEMIISSPIVRQAVRCQSSYFFSLVRGGAGQEKAFESILKQTNDAFLALRETIQVIDSSGVANHQHSAVRIMSSILQVQRFETVSSSLRNCQAHLSAVLTLFKQLLASSGVPESAGSSSSFDAILRSLGPTSCILPAQGDQIPSAEQAGFRFSTALLILDDIIASTVLQEEPKLYEHHQGLIGDISNAEPPVDLHAVVGCENWALLLIGEIAALDAWKQRCKRAGNLDVMQLVQRATSIKGALESNIKRLETNLFVIPIEHKTLLDIFTMDNGQLSETTAGKTPVVTRIWAHAALLYLSIVVSGWQPASVDVRYHIGRIFELIAHQISPPALLRTMTWPFCVAGCLVERGQEPHFRGLVQALQPQSMFGTAYKALEVMETVWYSRDSDDATGRDFASCFKNYDDLVLLI